VTQQRVQETALGWSARFTDIDWVGGKVSEAVFAALTDVGA
jgi:hypothetical protein